MEAAVGFTRYRMAGVGPGRVKTPNENKTVAIKHNSAQVTPCDGLFWIC